MRFISGVFYRFFIRNEAGSGVLRLIVSRRYNLGYLSASLVRWGITREPSWVYGSETTAPSVGTALVSQAVSSGKIGRVFGVHISADEANQFRLYEGATVKQRFNLNGAGTIFIVLANPLLDSVAAGTTISLKVVSSANSGKVYQANLLYDEA
jgi:hypothetical protein